MVTSTAAGGSPRPNLELDIDHAKSVYSMAYLDACCAQAGVALTPTGQDKDVIAVDATVEFLEQPVRVQLKCTSSPRQTKTGFTVPLKQRWIDLWSVSSIPVYLVLVVVPELQDGWISHTADETKHHTTAYWQLFDRTSKKRSLHLPFGNRLSRETMDRWREDALRPYGWGV